MSRKRITLKTQVEPGYGQWKGFHLVTVTATADAPGGKTIDENVRGYVPSEVGS